MKKVVFTRDSVCMMDEAFDHTKTIRVAPDFTFHDLLCLAQKEYLPFIQGGEATWLALAPGPAAVLAQQWKHPRLLPAGELLVDLPPTIQFRYVAQRNPDRLFQLLSLMPPECGASISPR